MRPVVMEESTVETVDSAPPALDEAMLGAALSEPCCTCASSIMGSASSVATGVTTPEPDRDRRVE